VEAMFAPYPNPNAYRVKTRSQGLPTPYSLSANPRDLKKNRLPLRPSKKPSTNSPLLTAFKSEYPFNFNPGQTSTPQGFPNRSVFHFGAETPSTSFESPEGIDQPHNQFLLAAPIKPARPTTQPTLREPPAETAETVTLLPFGPPQPSAPSESLVNNPAATSRALPSPKGHTRHLLSPDSSKLYPAVSSL
jgi:hypothetical protein